ncbi:MAG TPA: S41 family peptidase [Pyrinomonadaceae bacterium]|jgi:C-terminal processing protease CtpA/Prc
MKIEIYRRPFARAMMLLVFLGLLAAPLRQSAHGQTLDSNRRIGVEMAELIKKDIQKNYYDPTFRGINLDAHFAAVEAKVKTANSIGEILGIMARSLMEFNDSHTFFLIPPPADDIEQGWSLEMIGDKCFVTAVKPGSDAEAKGLKPGDEVLSLAGSTPTRDGLWKLWYFLRFQPSISLLVRSAGAETRSLTVMAKIVRGKPVYNLGSSTGVDNVDLIRQWENYARLTRHRYIDNKDLLIWKMPQFDDEHIVDEMMDKARNHKALILDLRGNGGGYEDTLLRLLGYMFDHDVKIYDIKSRTETKPMIAKTRGSKRIFNGELIVLVDSESGSSAELFARIVQLEKRGKVIGDLTSGSVMRAIHASHKSGMDLYFIYGASVTVSDLFMTDGKSLEGHGVTPDELLLPSSADLAAQRDPVLSRAADLAGFTVTPEKAGTFFPVEWKP